MTEDEWFGSKCRINQMTHLANQVYPTEDRKWLLVGVAFCRLLPAMPVNAEYAIDWVEALAEKCGESQIDTESFPLNIFEDQDEDYYAPGVAPVDRLLRACTEADGTHHYVNSLAETVMFDLRIFGSRQSSVHAEQMRSVEEGMFAAIRDIFGNPFHPVTFDPRWRTSTVVDLSQAIYDERAFDRMPILADALMDAGCDSDEMILHCRGAGLHVKGCWVVDLILGKE